MWEPGKPSQNENEYFARRDAEWLKERRTALDAERASSERTVASMKCPRCDGALVERQVENVRLDVCSGCHGVWLDAGELEMMANLREPALLHLGQDPGTK